MNQNNRRKQRPKISGPAAGSAAADGSEMWDDQRPIRHKWFRKRKRRGLSRSQPVDDEFDQFEERDEREDLPAEQEWSSAGYLELPEDGSLAGEELAARAVREQAWGIASAIDLYGCDAGLIRDAEAIRRFVRELCELIEMRRFGETEVVHFGEDERVAGYSMVQLIETSLISAHFANQTNAVYLDVFSCKPYNPQVVREFSKAFFRGASSTLQVAIRR